MQKLTFTILVIAVVGISAVALWNGGLTNRDVTEEVGKPSDVSGGIDSELRKLQVTVPFSDNDLERTGSDINRSERESALAVGRSDIEPHLLYQEYLSLAENGDTDAAYVLVTALNQCLYVVRSEDELTTEIIYRGKSQAVIEAARQSLSRCSPLFKMLPDLQKEHDRWYKVIEDAQHPLFLVEQRNRPYEEARQLVLSAIRQEYPERHMNQPVFLAASRLYMKYPEVGVDENRFHAWQLLACSAAIHCDHKRMSKMIGDEFSEARARGIFALEAQLNESLESGDIDSLGF